MDDVACVHRLRAAVPACRDVGAFLQLHAVPHWGASARLTLKRDPGFWLLTCRTDLLQHQDQEDAPRGGGKGQEGTRGQEGLRLPPILTSLHIPPSSWPIFLQSAAMYFRRYALSLPVVQYYIVMRIYKPIYVSRPMSTTVTHDRSPARGLWTYRKCLDLQAPFDGVGSTDGGSSGSGDGAGSPTSVSKVHELRAKHPGRDAQSLARTVVNCEGARTCLCIRRPA